MKALAVVLAVLAASPAAALDIRNSDRPVPPPTAEQLSGCLTAASQAHGVPVQLLYLILAVEDGRLGRVTPNRSGAPPDIGPAQVNGRWIRKAAERWGVMPERAFIGLRDSLCANLEMAAYIAALALKDGRGGFWERFAGYHSRTKHHQERYLRLAAEQASRVLVRKASTR